ncbi:MAG TPA: SH3 domain-containing protein [Thermomicrobiales bacterium]|nr:SH3 domain-containing protein [Thermomicrobiales bacterium]
MTHSSPALTHDPAANRRPEPIAIEIVDTGSSPRLPFRGARVLHVFCVLALVLSSAASVLIPAGRTMAQTGGSTITTAATALNLRTGPGTQYRVLLVIPTHGSVSVHGSGENGFVPVSHYGISGYVSGDLLRSRSYDEPVAPVTEEPVAEEPVVEEPVVETPPATSIGTATTTAYLNLRSGPGMGNGVIAVIPGGASVSLTGPSQDGFAPVTYDGQPGWVAEQYLTTGDGSTDEVVPDPIAPPVNPDPVVPETGTAPSGQIWATSAVNIRSSADTSSPVLTVVSAGATLLGTGQSQNGFWSVNYNGVVGWAYAALLTTDGSSYIDPPATNPGQDGVYGESEIINIIYAAADAYGQPREDMLRVARCESVLDPNAVNQAGGSYGLFQFLPGTWATTPFAQYDIFDPVANANAAAWMWSVGRRNEWVCQ